ncbi:putative transcription factor MYB-HB-like family [Helianthus debilis subsp. tardiflorus]
MVLQKRLDYGFNGYQVPPTPQAPRSAAKRISSCEKKKDHNRMGAFDILATVAGKLLLEGDNSVNKITNEELKIVNGPTNNTENDHSKANVCDQGNCNKSFFISEIIKAPVTDSCSGPASSITASDCRIEDINRKQMETEVPENRKPPVVDNVDCNLKLVIQDDDENSSVCTQPDKLNNKTVRAPTRIGDRRIRRLSASKQNTEVNRNKKSCDNYQRSMRDYPLKKRRLYLTEDPSISNVKSDSIENGSSSVATAQKSHVKLKIKSFRVPEFFIEIPETATVSSLKTMVMEAVSGIFSGELHVGLMLQGERIRDDNTLLQTGILHDKNLDGLDFTLEPSEVQVPPVLCPEDQPLTTYTQPQTVQQVDKSDREMSVDDKSGLDSRALVTVPAENVGPLAVVPLRKSNGAEVAQRRIRRPFSVYEVEALVEAVEKLGTGRWRDVKLRAFDDAKHRTYVDLKDKWKTLVHTASISPHQRRGEPVPQELLDRVLAAHGYWSHHQGKNELKHQLEAQTCQLV